MKFWQIERKIEFLRDFNVSCEKDLSKIVFQKFGDKLSTFREYDMRTLLSSIDFAFKLQVAFWSILALLPLMFCLAYISEETVLKFVFSGIACLAGCASAVLLKSDILNTPAVVISGMARTLGCSEKRLYVVDISGFSNFEISKIQNFQVGPGCVIFNYLGETIVIGMDEFSWSDITFWKNFSAHVPAS